MRLGFIKYTCPDLANRGYYKAIRAFVAYPSELEHMHLVELKASLNTSLEIQVFMMYFSLLEIIPDGFKQSGINIMCLLILGNWEYTLPPQKCLLAASQGERLLKFP